MCPTILLIGPLCAGKSTVGQLLAERVNLPYCSVDTLPLEDFTKLGLDMQRVEMLRETEGWLAAYHYMLEFGVRVVEQLLAEQRRRVIDFGAPYSTYEDDSLFERVKKAFAPYRNVVLLLPSPDLDESTRILKKRMAERKGHTKLRRWLMGLRAETGIDYEELYVKHRSNFQLAQVVIYTEGKSPEQTRDEIIEMLSL
jgi:shikimate kinase